MKTMIKKSLAILLSTCMFLSIFIMMPNSNQVVYATQSRKGNFSSDYKITGDAAQDILNVALAQVGKSGSDLGYSEEWCADFVSDCADLAGQGNAIPRTGAVSHEYSRDEPWEGLWQTILQAGGQEIGLDNAQPGDIVFFSGHVEIVYSGTGSNLKSIGGNTGKADSCYSRIVCSPRTHYNAVAVLRPNYEGIQPESKWYDDYEPVNLGDGFYAHMICQDNGCYLSNMEGNVGGADPIATDNQIWHFVRQSDGSYAILSYYDDLSMDVYAASTDNATNIQMMPYVGNTAQKFWIYSFNGAYYIRPQCTEYPFTINRQNNDNLEVWYFDPTFTNKRFDIIKLDLDGNMPISIGGDFYAQMVCEYDNCYLSNMEGSVGGADPIGTKNQIWHFKWLNDGSYSITSYYDGLSMDVAGAKTDNATNMQMMPYVGNTAQKFWIYSINGAYYIRSQCNEYPFTINGQNNDNLELWYYDPTFSNKRFDIIKMDCGGNLPINVEGDFNGDFYGKIKCNINGQYLTNIDSNVECAEDNDSNNQIWHFKWQHDGSYSITSYTDEKSMDIYCAKQENGTNVQMMPYVGNTAQRFWIYNMNDAYYIQPLCSALPFTMNEDNLEIWIYDKTFENKKFDIIEVTPKSKIEGDCNNDGEFNVSDVVLLQKWLLAVPNTHIANWKAANFCDDDRLDVFDLCLMKRKLIYG